MNTKKTDLIQLIGFLFASLVFLLLLTKLIHINKENKTLKLEKDIYKAERNQILNHFWENTYLIPNSIKLDLNNDSIIRSIAGDSYLALWISDKQCSTCVDFALSKLYELPDSIKDRTIVFSDYENPRIWKIVNEKISGRFKVICYPFSNKGSIYQTPFLGILTPNFEIRTIFYPIKEIPTLTDFYITKIVSNLR